MIKRKLSGINNMTPQKAYRECKNENRRILKLEEIIAADLHYSYMYARNVIKGPWERCEEAISKDPEYSYNYAKYVIKGPWERGEEAISKDPLCSYEYARNVIKGPWERGEEAISKDPKWLYWYAYDIIKGPFDKCHPIIFNSEYKDEYIDFLKSIKYDYSEWLI